MWLYSVTAIVKETNYADLKRVFVHLENQFYDSKFVYILCIKNPENNHDIAKEQKMLVTEYILLKTSSTKGQRAHRFGYQINM